jgi:hypothetical protein
MSSGWARAVRDTRRDGTTWIMSPAEIYSLARRTPASNKRRSSRRGRDTAFGRRPATAPGAPPSDATAPVAPPTPAPPADTPFRRRRFCGTDTVRTSRMVWATWSKINMSPVSMKTKSGTPSVSAARGRQPLEMAQNVVARVSHRPAVKAGQTPHFRRPPMGQRGP